MTNHISNSSRDVSRLVRRCLEEGNAVEIDGLGIFRPNGQGGFEFIPEGRPQVFIAYVVEDTEAVDRLCQDLDKLGFDPWVDRRKLLPGQNWPRAIERAIEMSRFFIACLSSNSVSKRGRFQSELRYALDCTSLIPLDETFLLPVRLNECRVPPSIAKSIQYVDLFPDWTRGVARIATMARKQERMRQRQAPPRTG